MEKVFDTKYGEVTVRNAMFDTDGTNLDEGIELKGDEIGLMEVYGYRDIEDMTEEEVEIIIFKKL